MKILLDGMDVLDIDMSNPANIKFSEIVKSAPSLVEGISNGGAKRFPPILAAAVRALWQDDGVRIAFANRSHLQLNDSAQYFFDSINRLSSVEYMPSDQDILRARVKTTGITETHFEIGDMNYRLFDVGGQRSERRKWLGIFENVTALIFLIAISECKQKALLVLTTDDQNLYEDETVNRMHEAMTLFESVVNSRWFVQTSIILFLNKTDLFAQKLSTSPLRETFAEYTGGDNYHLACEFLLSKYNALNHHPEKKMIYPVSEVRVLADKKHLTNATDTRALSFVVSAVTDVIMQCECNGRRG